MIASALGRYAYRRFLAACRDPLRAQVARLRAILDGAADSEFGQERDFRGLSRIRDPLQLVRAYQRRVPVRDWTAMRPDLEAVHRGHWRRLCPSPPLWFAMTAGSTGKYKYIPVTPEYRREVGRSSLIFQGALHASFPDVRRSRTQFLVGSAEGGLSPGGVPQGFASGFNYKNLPRILRCRFVVPYWVFTLDDPDERAYAAGRILVDEPRLGVLCAISPVNLINLRRTLERNAERLIRDVEAGTLTLQGRPAVPGTWQGTPSPSRASTLRDAWLAAGRFPNRALFPALRVLVCWQGGNMGYYLDELRAVFGIDRTFEFPISASEGVFAVPFRPDRPGGILTVTSHFLEFLPEDTTHTDTSALRADELEAGREYRLVVTNAGGLYRYDMEDIIRVTGHHRATPVIEFVSKKSRQISVSNERLTELDVTHAMLEASRRCGRWFEQFLFVPCSDRRYRVMLDGASPGAETVVGQDSPLRGLADELDRQLRHASMGYDFEREDGLLEPLQILVTRPGQLRSWLTERQSELRLPNAQVKPMHLTNEFDAHQRFTTEAAYVA